MQRLLRWRAILPIVAVSAFVIGCGGHASRTRDIRSALDAQAPREALALINEELEVDSAKDVPKDTGGDNALLLLDRSIILQQLGMYELSSRDLEIADKQIEVLDLSRNAADDIGKYMFSDDVGPYRAPTYEKLMINTLNMVNYLVRGDLNGARIEARRLAVMQKFIEEHESLGASLNGPGSYFAGFVFEKSGRPQEALRYYDEALQYGRYASLQRPVWRLAQKASYRTPRIREILKSVEGRRRPPTSERAPARPRPDADPEEPESSPEADEGRPEADEGGDTEPEEGEDVQLEEGEDTALEADAAAEPPSEDEGDDSPAPQAEPDDAEILVIVGFGRVPAKFAKRIPIGLALTWAAGGISPHHHRRANALAAQGLVTWVNYPELGKPRGQWGVPGVALDGRWQRVEGALAVDREAKRAWKDARGTVIGAAIVRTITRLAAGEATRRASGGGAVGLLLSLGTQAALTAADTPDTRSWATLPARIAIARLRVRPGVHWVDISVRGVRKRQRVGVRPGGWAVVNLTELS